MPRALPLGSRIMAAPPATAPRPMKSVQKISHFLAVS